VPRHDACGGGALPASSTRDTEQGYQQQVNGLKSVLVTKK
jgi:hypothetical protein